jgi:hypothetical protein
MNTNLKIVGLEWLKTFQPFMVNCGGKICDHSRPTTVRDSKRSEEGAGAIATAAKRQYSYYYPSFSFFSGRFFYATTCPAATKQGLFGPTNLHECSRIEILYSCLFELFVGNSLFRVFGVFRGSNFGCLPVRVRTQTGGFAALSDSWVKKK